MVTKEIKDDDVLFPVLLLVQLDVLYTKGTATDSVGLVFVLFVTCSQRQL